MTNGRCVGKTLRLRTLAASAACPVQPGADLPACPRPVGRVYSPPFGLGCRSGWNGRHAGEQPGASTGTPVGYGRAHPWPGETGRTYSSSAPGSISSEASTRSWLATTTSTSLSRCRAACKRQRPQSGQRGPAALAVGADAAPEAVRDRLRPFVAITRPARVREGLGQPAFEANRLLRCGSGRLLQSGAFEADRQPLGVWAQQLGRTDVAPASLGERTGERDGQVPLQGRQVLRHELLLQRHGR